MAVERVETKDFGDGKRKEGPGKAADVSIGVGQTSYRRNPFNLALGGEPSIAVELIKPQNNPFSSNIFNNKQESAPEEVKTARERFVPKADQPTTASAAPGKDLVSIIQQVDPSGVAQAFPQMIKLFGQVSSLLAIANAMGSGGDSSNTISESQTVALIDAFSESLCILSNRLSYEKVIKVLDKALNNQGITRIEEKYRDIVINGIAQLLQKAIIFGVDKIPIKADPVIVYGDRVPPAQLILPNLFSVPDLAVKQYYIESTDPFEGYIHFIKNGGGSVYVRRGPTDYPYGSVDEECLAIAEKGLADDLYPYFLNETLNTTILNNLLEKHKVIYDDNGMEAVVGKGSSKNLMSNLTAILGVVGTAVNTMQSGQLPVSVLNQGEVGKALQEFSKNMAMMDQMIAISSSAFGGGLGGALGGLGGLAGLGGLSNLVGALGGAGINLSSISGALGGVSQLSNLTSNFGTVGGITSALSSISTISGALSGAGISIPNLNLSSPIASVSSITSALQGAGSTASSLSNATNLLKNIGV
jgi:hypothetical protein